MSSPAHDIAPRHRGPADIMRTPGRTDRPILQFADVSKTYEDGVIGVTALKSINLTIARGYFTMVVGPSGSGKTTLLNLIGCIDTPTSGSITIDGTSTSRMGEKALTDLRAQKIGFIFQTFNLIPVLSAMENVEFALARSRLSAAQRREAVTEGLKAVGLYDQRDRRPNQLSGGQKQRVAIARALVKRPAIVLADEPTASLDTQTGAAVVDLMHRMQKEWETTFIFSTHDPNLIARADKLVAIRDGVLVDPQQVMPKGVPA